MEIDYLRPGYAGYRRDSSFYRPGRLTEIAVDHSAY